MHRNVHLSKTLQIARIVLNKNCSEYVGITRERIIIINSYTLGGLVLDR